MIPTQEEEALIKNIRALNARHQQELEPYLRRLQNMREERVSLFNCLDWRAKLALLEAAGYKVE